MAKKPVKKAAAKKTSPAKKTAAAKKAPVKKIAKKEVLDKLKPVSELKPNKSLKSRYDILLSPVENFEEEPLKEITEIKEALQEPKSEVSTPGVYVVTDEGLNLISEHGTTETVKVDGADTIKLVDNISKQVLDDAGLASKEMSIEPDAITFKQKFTSPGIYTVEKDGDSFFPKQTFESHESYNDWVKESSNEELVDEGDLEIQPSYDTDYVRDKYGNYIVVFILLFLGLLLFIGNNKPETQISEPTSSITNVFADTIIERDTVVTLIDKGEQVNRQEIDSLKGEIKKNKETIRILTYRVDSLLIDLGKYAKPIYINTGRSGN